MDIGYLIQFVFIGVWMNEKYKYVIIGVIASTILGYFFTYSSTLIHEASHNFVAKMLGCKSSSEIMMGGFSGKTDFECLGMDTKTSNILIAIAPIIICFLVATALFLFFDENNYFYRGLGIVLYLVSTLPSASFFVYGSDASYLISQGFNYYIMVSIYLFMVGIAWYNIISEIMEKPFGQHLKEYLKVR